MLYMVVEKFPRGPAPVYARAAARGRMLPPGLRYVNSWVVADDKLDRCFQLMETDDPVLFEKWIAEWKDLADFEVLPVVDSKEAAKRVAVAWPGGSGRAEGEQAKQ
ncbi:hypothetical protein DFJ74DRAFT_768343 [Hyaloraphidium curvatum]|nr:hypothetical protein DFJ74DRAFT_768343 [Hyaloraphidium curvatum]